MSLPADSRCARHHAEYQTAPRQRDDDAEEDADEAAGVPAGQHQESEIAEDHAASSDVHRPGRAEQPRQETGSDHPGQSHRNEMTFILEHHHPAKHHERDAVGDEMIEATVQEGSEQNTAETNSRAWYDA